MWERGLVERKSSPVNWCPSCATVLANEQVVGDGVCWRCKSVVEKRELEQWYFKITDYAQQLLDDLDELPGWPERVKTMQANWIGRSEGAEVEFTLCDEAGEPTDERITVFTTRPDTLFGCTFFLLAPEHPLVARLVEGTAVRRRRQRGRRQRCARRPPSSGSSGSARSTARSPAATSRTRSTASRCRSGSPTTCSWTTAPARSWPCPAATSATSSSRASTGCRSSRSSSRRGGRRASTRPSSRRGAAGGRLGRGVQRARRDGATPASSTGMAGGKDSEGMHAVTAWLAERGQGREIDQLPPARLAHQPPALLGQPDSGGALPDVRAGAGADEDLPVVLPMDIDITKGETLADHPEFYETTCPKCGGAARRETDTMDTFTCSSLVLPALHRRAQRRRCRSRRTTRTTGCRSTSTSAASSTRSCTCCTRASSPRCCRTWGMVDCPRAVHQPAHAGHGQARRRHDEQVQGQRGRARGHDRASTAATRCAPTSCSWRRPTRTSSGASRASTACSASWAACGASSPTPPRRPRRQRRRRCGRPGEQEAAPRDAPRHRQGHRRRRALPVQHRDLRRSWSSPTPPTTTAERSPRAQRDLRAAARGRRDAHAAARAVRAAHGRGAVARGARRHEVGAPAGVARVRRRRRSWPTRSSSRCRSTARCAARSPSPPTCRGGRHRRRARPRSPTHVEGKDVKKVVVVAGKLVSVVVAGVSPR